MPMKIFELAKELDMGAIELVEDLKQKGFEVRNHMTALSDEDVEKVKASYRASSAATTVVKKVVKKKVVKKAEPAVKVETKTAAASDDEGAKKSVTRKKRTVIRKKAGESDDEAETPVQSASLQEALSGGEIDERSGERVSKPKTQADDAKGSSRVEYLDSETRATGLRVVSKAVRKEEAPAPASAQRTEAKEGPEADVDEKEYYQERVHKFTPVYIPPADESGSSDETTRPAPGTPAADEDDEEKKSADKKRLGGLATMMSGKKAIVSRSAAITQERADSELKSYQALSGTGRPLYSTIKKKKTYAGPTQDTVITEIKEHKRVVKFDGAVTAMDLARKLKVKFKDLIDEALTINLLIKQEDYLGPSLAADLASLYDYRVEDTKFDEDEVLGKIKLSDEEKDKLPVRDPIITIMGHVDHGKTTLMDYIRSAKVAQGEAGGITQHIGAYSVHARGKTLTFLDTPGHAAFANMRQRGANVTDIVVLVVAADDGVMPQTKESIRFIKEAGVPVIVAINKMDKEGVNPDRVKQELTEFNLMPEEWGGDTQMVPISALQGTGIDELLDSIAIQAEMLDLRADASGNAEGVVIESKIEQGRGPVATILVQTGTLKKGDSLVVGETYGRARSLTDSMGNTLESAGPSIPVQILGLTDPPSPGDKMNIVKSEREAKKIVENRLSERKALAAAPAKPKMSLEDFFAAASESTAEKKELALIIRADVQGSYEAIVNSLNSLSNQEVNVKVIGGGVGPITDNDVNLAQSSGAYMIGFNMRPITTARKLAEQFGIDVKTYSIIYELINDITLALEGLLDPDLIEEFNGRAEVRETFQVPKVGTIAGCVVVDGSIKIGCSIRLLRDGKILHDGKLSSLKRFKDDVKEVKNGYECGMGLENYNDVKIGDIFEAYSMVEKKRTLKDVRASTGESQPTL